MGWQTVAAAVGNALGPAYAGFSGEDPQAYSAHLPKIYTTRWCARPIHDELLGLRNAAISDSQYGQQFACDAGDAVGDPVRLAANNQVILATADTEDNAKVIGFVRHKGTLGSASAPAATTCYISHVRYVSGLVGGTYGDPVYLQDDGSLDIAPGTIAKVVGTFISATEAILSADGHSANFVGVSGGTVNFLPYYDTANSFDLSPYGFDGTYGALMKIGSTTFNAASTLARWRGGSVPASFAASSGNGQDLYIRAQDAAAGGGGNGASYVLCPGAKDGAGSEGYFAVIAPSSTSHGLKSYHNGSTAVIETFGGNDPILYRINGIASLALTVSFNSSSADATQGTWGYNTTKSYFMSAASSAADLSVGRKGANILRLTNGAETDASTFLMVSGSGSAPASYTHGSAGGTDVHFRAQSAFAASGGNGGNIYFMPGSADGAGTAGRFRICLAGDATKYVDIYKDAFGNAFYVNSESGGYTLFRIGGTTVFAIAQNITTSAADAAQGAFGFWTDKSYFLGAAGSSSDITLGRKSANVLRLTAGAETDASTGLAIGANSTPAAYTNSSDATGKYAVFRAQSGGTHTASNPDGGGFSFILGAKGSGGSGSMGQFRIYESSAGDYAYFTYSSGSHMYLGTSSGKSLIISPNSSLVCRDAALATGATEGDLYIPSSAGKPTGTPTTYTGTVPLRADTTNNVVWAYLNSQWAQIGGEAWLLPAAAQRTGGHVPFTTGTILTVSDTAYWVYLGYTLKPRTITYLVAQVTTAGAGVQTAELCLASTPSAPNKAGQTLTKLAATGSVDSLVGTGVIRNSSSFAYACPAGVHLWAGIRTAMTITEPTFRAYGLDWGEGHYLSTATAGALTGAGPWTGATVSTTSTAAAPQIRVEVD